jgi:hypothetical protein
MPGSPATGKQPFLCQGTTDVAAAGKRQDQHVPDRHALQQVPAPVRRGEAEGTASAAREMMQSARLASRRASPAGTLHPRMGAGRPERGPGSTGGKTNGYTSDLRRLGGFLAPAPGAAVRIAPLSETFTGQVI